MMLKVLKCQIKEMLMEFNTENIHVSKFIISPSPMGNYLKYQL